VIIITGSVLGDAATIDEMATLSLEHVRRSRQEPGCLSHAVFRHVEEPNRLVFVERWADMTAVQQHFAVPESGAFVDRLRRLAVGPPSLEIYDAAPHES
jgi:quinol monooxygenase YgiN